MARAGLGSPMLRFLEEDARQQRYVTMRLDTNDALREARQLYEGAG